MNIMLTFEALDLVTATIRAYRDPSALALWLDASPGLVDQPLELVGQFARAASGGQWPELADRVDEWDVIATSIEDVVARHFAAPVGRGMHELADVMAVVSGAVTVLTPLVAAVRASIASRRAAAAAAAAPAPSASR